MATRIGIIGAGAIGSIVGGMLSKAGRDVTLVDPWPTHVETMKRDGLRLSGSLGDFTVPVRALHISDLQGVAEPFDLAFVAVKSYDTDWATTLIAPFVAGDGAVVCAQNGINDDRVAAIVGRERTLGCVITLGAGLYAPGHAVRTDTSAVGFRVGELDGKETARAGEIAAVLSDVAQAVVTTNLWGERWAKLATNCMANPIAGLTGYGSAELRRRPETRRVSIQIAAEVIRVGRALGHDVETVSGMEPDRLLDAAEGRGLEELEAQMEEGAERLGEGRPSFLQDVMRGRRTEIDFLNGYVSEQGRKVAIPTPFNDGVVKAVHAFPVGSLVPDPKNLESVAALL